jgi:DNA-directed RNA polymerase subunit RPC12/RpoP
MEEKKTITLKYKCGYCKAEFHKTIPADITSKGYKAFMVKCPKCDNFIKKRSFI